MKPRGRPQKSRYVQNMPKITQFSPRGKPGRPEEVMLTIDQLEALNLADFKHLSQLDGSRIMGISRPSFSRLIKRAHRIVADALVNGKIIRIGGGPIIYSTQAEKMVSL